MLFLQFLSITKARIPKSYSSLYELFWAREGVTSLTMPNSSLLDAEKNMVYKILIIEEFSFRIANLIAQPCRPKMENVKDFKAKLESPHDLEVELKIHTRKNKINTHKNNCHQLINSWLVKKTNKNLFKLSKICKITTTIIT